MKNIVASVVIILLSTAASCFEPVPSWVAAIGYVVAIAIVILSPN
jgi:hypothetical protein